MSNPKFMTFTDFKKREEEEAAKKKAAREEGVDISSISNENKSNSANSSPSTSSKRVHTLADINSKSEEEMDGNEMITDPDKIIELMQKYNIPMKSIFWILIKLLVAISLQLLLVIILVKVGQRQDYMKRVDRKKVASSFLDKMLTGVLQTLIFIIGIILMTIGLYFLYLYEWYKVMFGIVCTLMTGVFFCLVFVIFRQILIFYNIPLDVFTSLLIIWNFSVLVIVSIFWRAPYILSKASPVFLTATISYILTVILSPLYSWALLVLLVIWDLFAVLSPYGPLNLLMKAYKKRNQGQDQGHGLPPGLLFSTVIIFNFVPKEKEVSTIEGLNTEELLEQINNQSLMGLGDFVFYGLLIGKAATHQDLNLILGSYVSIIFGVLIIIYLSAMNQKPLPALPISISIGIVVFAVIYFCGTPFLNQLNSVFINI